jgi:hypothetical protein
MTLKNVLGRGSENDRIDNVIVRGRFPLSEERFERGGRVFSP